jgi:glycine hydroxymethyltransferase
MHVIAAKAVLSARRAAVVQALRKNVAEKREGARRNHKSKGLDIVSGGTDTHLMLVDLRPKR